MVSNASSLERCALRVFPPARGWNICGGIFNSSNKMITKKPIFISELQPAAGTKNSSYTAEHGFMNEQKQFHCRISTVESVESSELVLFSWT